MTLQTSGQISISQINTEVADVNSNSLATLAANSHEYKTALDNLQNAPHAMSEWYGYDDDILWEHEIVVGHSTYGAKTTFHRYGFDSDDFDYTLGSSVDMGTCSESNPRWAAAIGRQNVHVGWFLWDSQEGGNLQIYLWRATGTTPTTNTGFTSVQIQTIVPDVGTFGVGPLARTDASSYELRTAAPAFDKWIWTHGTNGVTLNSSPFHTTVGATSTIRWY